jgi:hypothetical protein
MSREINPFGLRMPPALRATLEESAQKAGRSLNSEIVHRLLAPAAAPSPEQLKRQVVVDALLEAVGEVCRWAEHMEHGPDENAERWLKEALDDLSMWNTRLQRFDSGK